MKPNHLEQSSNQTPDILTSVSAAEIDAQLGKRSLRERAASLFGRVLFGKAAVESVDRQHAEMAVVADKTRVLGQPQEVAIQPYFEAPTLDYPDGIIRSPHETAKFASAVRPTEQVTAPPAESHVE
jgi:hypothetical protein